MEKFDDEIFKYCYDYLTGRIKLQKCRDISVPSPYEFVSWFLIIVSTFMVLVMLTDATLNIYHLIALLLMMIAIFLTIVIYGDRIVVFLFEKIFIPILTKIRDNQLKQLQRHQLAYKLCASQTIQNPKIREIKEAIHPQIGVPLTQLTIEQDGDILHLYTNDLLIRLIGAYGIRRITFRHEFIERTWYR